MFRACMAFRASFNAIPGVLPAVVMPAAVAVAATVLFGNNIGEAPSTKLAPNFFRKGLFTPASSPDSPIMLLASAPDKSIQLPSGRRDQAGHGH